MNVLQVNKLYHPQVGGVERVVQATAEGLVDRGHDVSVLAGRPRGPARRDYVDGVWVDRATTLGTVLSVPLAPGFPIALRRAVRRTDVVHHHLPNPLSPVSDLAVAARDDRPTVVTYHSDIVRQAAALRLYGPVLDRFLDRVDRILVTSPRLRDHSDRLAPHREKTTVVPLSVDLDRYGAYDGSPYDLPGDPDRPTVLFVGRLNYYKGVEYLLAAVDRADREFDLLVAGDGARRERLERRSRAAGVADRVHFLGYVEDERLRCCYDRADLFALPSVEPSEAFGVVQLEAMAHRTPVVNTALPTGVPWVSRDGETGLTVPPRDPEALAGAVDELLADPDRRERYGRAARRRVERRFTRDRMLDDVEGVYRELHEESADA